MRSFLFLIFTSTLFFLYSCDGAEHELGHDDYCYFQPQLEDISDGCEGTVYFTFTNTDTGEVLDWNYEVGETTSIISLPKNACYDFNVVVPYGCLIAYSFYNPNDDILFVTEYGGDDWTNLEFCLQEDCSTY